jgi:preprotein translocase subunit YajC
MLFLQAAQGGNPLMTYIMLPLMLAVMYFFFIRPQVQQQKKHQKFIESLKEGMDVTTSAGIIGKITKIDGDVVRLLVDEKTFIRVQKHTINAQLKPNA